MAVIVLASASGAPGVTTTALALTLLWPRSVLLVEASPFGGSAVLAGYLRGAVAPAGRSMLGLARAQRQGRLRDAVRENSVALDEDGSRHLLPGVPQPEQAASLDQLWEPLAALLPQLVADGVDVIVDAGRLGAAHGPDRLLQSADAVLLCTGTQLPAVAAVKARCEALRRMLPAPQEEADDSRGGTVRSPDRLGLLIVGDGRPYTGADVAGVTGVPVVASLAWDQPAAGVLSFGTARPRRWEQSAYIRSASAAAVAVQRGLSERLSSAAHPSLVGGASRA